MTDLQRMYLTARSGNVGHYAALRKVEAATGIDAETIVRCLDRAREADAMDARRARKGNRKAAALRMLVGGRINP